MDVAITKAMYVYVVLVICLAVSVAGQCPVSTICSQCDPGGRAVCGSICPVNIPLPPDIIYLSVSNGTCDNWVKLALIRSDYFQTYNSLQVLNLTSAHVERLFASPFTGMPNVKDMDLSHNLIKSFSLTAWAGISLLETLDLSYNNILGVLSAPFSKLTSLKHLNLFNNNFSVSLTNTSFGGLTNLETLNLGNNPLSYVDGSVFQPLVSIITIEMKNMTMTSIASKLFSDLNTLRNVDASENKISFVAGDFLTGTSLDLLNLSNNFITSIPTDAFRNSLAPPKVINLSNNKITQISSTDLKGLTVNRLDLSGNPITTVAGDAFDGTSISYIDLSNTGLTSLPNATEAWLKGSTSTIDLTSTNWLCDCTSLWFARLLQTKGNIKSPTCTGKYSGTTLKDARSQLEADCMTTTTTTSTTTTTPDTTTTPTTTTTTTPTTTTTTSATPTTTTTSTITSTSTTTTSASTSTTPTATSTTTSTSPTTTSTTTTTTPLTTTEATTTSTSTSPTTTTVAAPTTFKAMLTTLQTPPLTAATPQPQSTVQAPPPQNPNLSGNSQPIPAAPSTTSDIVQMMPIVLAVMSTIALCLAVAGLIAGCYLCRKTDKISQAVKPRSMKLAWQQD